MWALYWGSNDHTYMYIIYDTYPCRYITKLYMTCKIINMIYKWEVSCYNK